MPIQDFCPFFFLVIAFLIDMHNFFTYSLYKSIASKIYYKYLLLLLTSLIPFSKMPFEGTKSWEIGADIYIHYLYYV